MTASFLSPRPTDETLARSPLLDAASADGCGAEVRDGWQVVAPLADPAVEAAACAETVGFADRSSLAKFELQLAAGATAEGFDGGRARRAGDGWRCPVRPGRDLVLCESGSAESVRAELEGGPARLCDLTAALAALTLAGPLALETFARFCALDLRETALPVGGFRPGSVARTAGYVLREGPQRYLVLFGAAYATYIWETVADAVAQLGGRPVSGDALPPIAVEASDA